jgi:hypothetical protein
MNCRNANRQEVCCWSKRLQLQITPVATLAYEMEDRQRRTQTKKANRISLDFDFLV